MNDFVGQMVFRISTGAETIDAAKDCTIAAMISNLIGIPRSIVTVKIIKDYTDLTKSLLGNKKEVKEIVPTLK